MFNLAILFLGFFFNRKTLFYTFVHERLIKPKKLQQFSKIEFFFLQDSFDWVTKNKKKKKIPAVVNSENAVENHNDESGSFDAWDDNKNASASTFRGRGSYPRNNSRAPVRGGGIRRGVNNRSADGKNRPCKFLKLFFSALLQRRN